MKTLMETVVELMRDWEANPALADAVIAELIEWGAVSAEEGAKFQEVWDNEDGEDV